MKEFDICIRTPPEGDIIVYLLPHHTALKLDGLRILLNASLRDRAIKYVVVQNRIALKALIEKCAERSFMSLSDSVGIGSGGRESKPLLTQADEPLLTRNGTEIDAVTVSGLVALFENKMAAPEALRVAILPSVEEKAVKYFTVPLETCLDFAVEQPVLYSFNTADFQVELEEESLLPASEVKQLSTEDCFFRIGAGGRRVRELLTRGSAELLTQNGDGIDAVSFERKLLVSEIKTMEPEDNSIGILCQKDISVSEAKTASPIADEIGILCAKDVFAFETKTVSPDTGTIGVQALNELPVSESKTLSPDAESIGLTVTGVGEDSLLTRSGAELLTRNGDGIKAAWHWERVSLLEMKTISPEEELIEIQCPETIPVFERKDIHTADFPVQVGIGGVIHTPVLTRENTEILTRDGKPIDSVEMSKTVFVAESKLAAPEANIIHISAGGRNIDRLLTRDGAEILSQDGESIYAMRFERGLRISETKAMSLEENSIGIHCSKKIPVTETIGFLAEENSIGVICQKELSVAEIKAVSPETNAVGIQSSKEIAACETKATVLAPESIGLAASGTRDEALLTSGGDELLTRDGEPIGAFLRSETVLVSEIKTTVPEANAIGVCCQKQVLVTEVKTASPIAGEIGILCPEDISAAECKTAVPGDMSAGVCVSGVANEAMLTDGGAELLTRDGKEINAVARSASLHFYLSSEAATKENCTGIAAGGAMSDFLLTRDGTRIMSRDSDNLIGTATLSGVPLYIRNRVVTAGSVSLRASVELLPSQYRRLEVLDGSDLQTVDGMTLDDIEHVIT